MTYFRECRPEKLTKAYPGQRDDIYAAQKDMSTTEAALDSPRRQVLNTSAAGAGAMAASAAANSSFAGALSHSHSASQFGSQSMRSTRKGVAASGKKKLGGGGGGGGNAQLRPVVRTIYLPNENIEILKQIIASLRSQLSEQHTLFEQRIQALQEDRAIREQETAEVQRRANAHIQELANELKAVNDLNKLTTRGNGNARGCVHWSHVFRLAWLCLPVGLVLILVFAVFGLVAFCFGSVDYLELRHAAQLNERKLKERASVLSQQQVDLQKHLKEVEGRAAVRTHSTRLACTARRVTAQLVQTLLTRVFLLCASVFTDSSHFILLLCVHV